MVSFILGLGDVWWTLNKTYYEPANLAKATLCPIEHRTHDLTSFPNIRWRKDLKQIINAGNCLEKYPWQGSTDITWNS